MVSTSTPSVKGIYTAIFLLILTNSVFSQIEMKDNTTPAVPFHKWELGFDLKPLFQKDESYNMLVKWHFTEKKAIRLRIGSGSRSSSSDSINLDNKDFLRIEATRLQYQELLQTGGKKFNGQFSIGYQYSFINRQVSFYTATEFKYEQFQEDFNLKEGGVTFSNTNLYDSLKSNIYYHKTVLYELKHMSKTYGVSQIIGVGYKINPHLSISSEFAIGYFRTSKYIYTRELLPTNSSTVLQTSSEFTSGGTSKGFFIKPLLGLYLNYHF
jgi:hypothetical protein